MKNQYVQTCLRMPDYISFKTECECFAHDLHISFEKDMFGYYELILNDAVIINENDDNFFKKICSRIKYAFQMLFKGYVEFDYEFAFKGKEHVEEFLKYMNETYAEISKK